MLKRRRNILLQLLSYGTWDFDLTSFPYVYHSLLPNGSEVVKGKIAKIYANGVIENQLINDNFESTSSYWTKNRLTQTENTFVVNSNEYAEANFYHQFSAGQLVKSRHYLMSVKIKIISGNINQIVFGVQGVGTVVTINNPQKNVWLDLSGVFIQARENTETTNGFNVTVKYASTSDIVVDSDTFQVGEPKLIDLTLREGTGNEPTNLTDNRIQNILNRGYIAYNQGEYKGTNVSEIATEPYNLANNVFTFGWWSGNVGSQIGTSNYRFDMKLAPISVLPSTSYTLEFDNISGANINGYIIETDENGIVLVRNQYITSGTSITFTSNTHYAYIYFYDRSEQVEIGNTLPNINACFHRTGTRTGYAPHKPSASIPFIYQGNGNETNHDNLEITKTEFVFTKEVNYVDSVTMPTTLTTPQVVRIPRKHLGIVDLGSVTWEKSTIYGRTMFRTNNFSIVPMQGDDNVVGNIYCSAYLSTNYTSLGSGDNIISLRGISNEGVVIYDSSKTSLDATQFKTAMSGIYLFYETAEEIDDIATRIFTENGGTVSALEQRLPREYQEVEYIESTGTQYINTGYVFTSENIKIDFGCYFPYSTTNMSLFGSNSPSYNLVPYSYGNREFTHWVGSSSNILFVQYEVGNNDVSYELNKSASTLKCTLNGNTTSATYSGTAISSFPIYIFGKNGGGSSQERGNGYRLNYFKMYDNNLLVRNFIPCYRKSDNVIGLYDLVGKQFYTNAGTGTFVKGSDVNTNTNYCEVLPNLDLDLPVKV